VSADAAGIGSRNSGSIVMLKMVVRLLNGGSEVVWIDFIGFWPEAALASG
jgi:hypothetical protein